MSSASLAPGDRVCERGRPGLDVATAASPNYQQVCAFRHSVRKGQIVSLRVRLDRSGRRNLYADVLWDGRTSPSQHSVNRLRRLEEPERV